MKPIACVLLPVVVAVAAGPRSFAEDKVQLDVLLNRPLAHRYGLPEPIGDTFVLSPHKLVVVSAGGRLYAVGRGGAAPIANGLEHAQSFAYTRDGLFVVLKGGILYALAGEEYKPLMQMTFSDVAVVASFHKPQIYVHDRGEGNQHGLFVLLPGMSYKKILDSPVPIQDIAEIGERLFLATELAVYEVTPNRPMRLVIALPPGYRLRSMAGDPKSGLLYLSNLQSIHAYSVEKQVLYEVFPHLGGYLRLFDGSLFVLKSEDALVVRVPDPSPQGVLNEPSPMEMARRSAAGGRLDEATRFLRTVVESEPDWVEPYYSLGLVEEYRTYHEGIDHAMQAVKWFEQFMSRTDAEDLRRKEVERRTARLEAIQEGYTYRDKVSRYLERANEVSGAAGRMIPASLILRHRDGDQLLGTLAAAQGQGFYFEYSHDLVGGESVQPEVFALGGLLGTYRFSLAFDPDEADGARAIRRLGFTSWGVMWIPRAGLYVRLGAPRPLQWGPVALRPSVISSGAFAFFPKGFHKPSEELKAARPDFRTSSIGLDPSLSVTFCK